MLIFRSEDHVKNWSQFNPEAEDTIMPLADWAQVFSQPFNRNRLQPDYVARSGEYVGKFWNMARSMTKK